MTDLVRRGVASALGVVVALLAGVVACGVFADNGWVLPVLAAAVVPAAFAFGVGTFRGPLLGGLAGLGSLALLLALGIAPGRDLVSGGRRLLTGTLPLDTAGPEVAAVVAAVGAASLLAAAAALVTRRFLLVAVPGLLALAVALAVSASSGAPPGWAVALVVVAVAGLLAVGGSGFDRAPRALLAVALVALGTVVAVNGSSLPGASARSDRADARDLVDEPVRPRDDTNPLSRVAGLLSRPATPVLRVRGAGADGDRLRLATLDTFEGSRWTSEREAFRAGESLPTVPTDGLPQTRRTLQVEVLDPSLFAFLPTYGRADAVSVSGLGVVRQTGDLLVPAGDEVPLDYRVEGGEINPSRLPLAAATAARTAPLVVPDRLRQQAVRLLGRGPDFTRLATLATSLSRRDLATGDAIRGGSGLFQVQQLIADGGVGTSEQYASAFAVLARTQGFTTRVVVGLDVPAPDRGVSVVRSNDVVVYPEVLFARYGWLPFDPTPDDGSGSSRGALADAVARQSEQATRTDPEAPPGPQPTPPVPSAPAPAADGGVPALLVGSVVVVLLLLLALAAVPLLKLRRRRARRGADSPGARVVGAWADTAERLQEAGAVRAPGTTPADLRAAAPAPVGEDVGRLGALVDQAAWSGAATDPAAADEAWAAADRVRDGLRAGRTRPERVRATLDPRALL